MRTHFDSSGRLAVRYACWLRDVDVGGVHCVAEGNGLSKLSGVKRGNNSILHTRRILGVVRTSWWLAKEMCVGLLGAEHERGPVNMSFRKVKNRMTSGREPPQALAWC